MKAVLITSSILIVLIAALRPILRGKIDPRVQYALWMMAALRLLVPVNLVTSAYSVLALLDRGPGPAQIVQTIGQTTVPLPEMSYEDAYDRALQEYEQNRPAASGFTDLNEVEHRARELQAQRPTLAELAAKYARPVWLGGAAVTALWFLLVNGALRRKLRGAKRLHGVNCLLPVYVSGALPSPCLCGAVRPAVYVTPAALESPDRLRHVLAHELTHYRHRDHWWALVRCLCLCVYWFDPLVWWAAALSRQDCELACDAGAIRVLGEGERIPYGRTLVSMIAAGRTPLMQTATTMAGGKRRIKERVTLIARRPQTIIAVALALVLIVGCAVGCTFTGAPEEVPSQDLSAETLQERLMDVPEEWRDKVVNNVDLFDDTSVRANYWLDDPKWEDLWSGYLMSVYELDQGQLDNLSADWSGGMDVFAQRDGLYYAIFWPNDDRYKDDPELGGEYWGAQDAIREYAIQQVLATEGMVPLPADSPAAGQQAIQAAMDRIIGSPSIELTLAPGGTSRVYAYTIPGLEEWDGIDFWAPRLGAFAADYDWEYAGEEIRDLPGAPDGDTLKIWTPDGSFIQVWSNSNIMLVQRTSGDAAETAYYEARDLGRGTFLSPGLFQSLRLWFDEVEISRLRTLSVPDRGQSHLEVVEEWIDGFEGAMTRCAPGSMYACTYAQPIGVVADHPNWIAPQELDNWAKTMTKGYDSADFGKTWFGFSYSLVFVAENENAKNCLMTGNTTDYVDEAPEGAQIWSRVGYMELIDGQWVCEGTSTGW